MSTISMKAFTENGFIKDSTFIKKHNIKEANIFKGEIISPDMVKTDIINSVKFIIPKDLMNLRCSDGDLSLDINTVNASFESHIPVNSDKDFFDYDCISNKDFDKNINTWVTYGTKMPFPLMFLENDTGGILLKQNDGYIDCIYILTEGTVVGVIAKIFPNSFTEEYIKERKLPINFIGNKLMHSALQFCCIKENHDKITDQQERLVLSYSANVKLMKIVTVITLQILSFINARNIKQITYKPTKKETSKIPNSFKRKYEYTTIDIFRERKEYHSLEEFVNSSSHVDRKEIRAHLVRGHFKHKKNGVFWWNSFIRNNKNTNVLKAKDYVLHS